VVAAPAARGGETDRTRALYRGRGFLGRVGFGTRPAVVVVDAIVGFTDRRSPLAGDFDAELGQIRRVLTAGRAAAAPIYFTTVAYDRRCTEAGVFVEKVPSLRYLIRGSRWVALDPRLGRRPGDTLIEKQFASAFFATPLASMLTTRGVDTVVVTGFTTSGCVRATAVDALQHGFRPIVPRECVGDRAPGPHEANLLDIDGKYGDVVAVDEVVAYFERRTAAPPRARTRRGQA
jgi:nicotinamidase-related amidase